MDDLEGVDQHLDNLADDLSANTPLLPLSLSLIFPTPIALGWMIPLGQRNPHCSE